MEFAYDHIQEEVVAQDMSNDKGKDLEKPKESLNEEFQEAYKALSASPWGARFGNFVGTVKKQGESYYQTGKKEAAIRAEQASKGFGVVRSEIVNRARSLSVTQGGATTQPPVDEQTGETSRDGAVAGGKLQQEEGLLSKLRKGAAQRISEIEAVETRADEYLLRFGTNIGNFLKEAVTIRPPEENEEEEGLDGGKKELVFGQKGEEGKRQIYSTRLDAQLHLLHGNLELFKMDSNEVSFVEWSKKFSADSRTEQIATDLDKYPELRGTMEKLVPDSVQYMDFWRRYYFLRNELDMEEQKRKELLKGATALEEEIGWDEDDEDESDTENHRPTLKPTNTTSKATATAQPAPTDIMAPNDQLKPKNSIDRVSQPDSESSYDVISGVPSQAPSQAAGSPKAAKTVDKNRVKDSDEEEEDDDDDDEEGSDWE